VTEITPPGGATRAVDPKPPTEDEVLLESPSPREGVELHKASDSWRALRILGEFVWGFENLERGVSTRFGPHPAQRDYQAATETAWLLLARAASR
jgi:hypothetical protein